VVHPLPTTTRLHLTQEHRRLVERTGAAWLIVRARQDYADLIARSFCRNLRQADVAVDVLRRKRFGTLSVMLIGANASAEH
jgi:hypothetical protein